MRPGLHVNPRLLVVASGADVVPAQARVALVVIRL